MERELRNKIEKAKNIAINLKLNPDSEDQFMTSASGVKLYYIIGTHLPLVSNLNELQWRVLENLFKKLIKFCTHQITIRKNDLTTRTCKINWSNYIFKLV